MRNRVAGMTRKEVEVERKATKKIVVNGSDTVVEVHG